MQIINTGNKATMVEQAVIEAVNNIKTAGPLIAAVSGGADSTALLFALSRQRDTICRAIHCVHIQHNLRGDESLADEQAVLELSRRLGIPCSVRTVPHGQILKAAKEKGYGIEAAAREARHALLKDEAQRLGAVTILVAHNYDDLLETIIMRVLRGAGPSGLAAMPLCHAQIVRPLLHIPRIEIIRYLEEHRIRYCTDSSNQSDNYLRNRVRHHLVPVLDKFFPDWKKNLVEMAQTQRLVDVYLKKRIKKALQRGISKTKQNGEITLQNFFAFPAILREELIFHAVDAVESNSLNKDNDAFYADQPQTKTKIPRRSTVRKFADGSQHSVELGAVILNADGSDAKINIKKTEQNENNFTLMIKKEGCYKAGNLTINCKQNHDGSYTFVIYH